MLPTEDGGGPGGGGLAIPGGMKCGAPIGPKKQTLKISLLIVPFPKQLHKYKRLPFRNKTCPNTFRQTQTLDCYL